jgi:hypothetical protein
MAERRTTSRKMISQPAGLYHPDGKPICDCTLRDISEYGARLKIREETAAHDTKIPPTFILAISKSGNVFRRCEVIWRTEDEVGVKFSRSAS